MAAWAMISCPERIASNRGGDRHAVDAHAACRRHHMAVILQVLEYACSWASPRSRSSSNVGSQRAA